MKKSSDFVHSALRNRIVSGQYEPGSQLREEHLAEEFGVSRTPVRSALKRLADDGLVSVELHRGVFVARWTRWDIAEMFHLRATLEPQAARLAAEHRDSHDIADLHRINAEMECAIVAGGDGAMLGVQSANTAFHKCVLNCGKSQRLKSILANLIDMPVITRSFVLYAPSDFERSLQQHRDITYAVEIQDGDLAASLMEGHIRLAYRRFMSKRLDMPLTA